jgi:triosephosphate isomerase (TIM)
MRKRICAGNWKMYKTTSETRAYIERFTQLAASVPDRIELIICPPFTSLQTARDALAQNTRIRLGAQNMHWEQSGAFTGAISPPMLVDLNVQYVIIGHSESREYFGETDETVARKAAAALQNGLTPIIAVGESLDIRRAGRAESHVVAQTIAALSKLDSEQLSRVILAYEPIWAIGTGANCDAAAANEIMHAMRESRGGLQDVPILYGGSVKPENVAEYAAMPDINGGLVGGASLDPDTFAKLALGAA